MTLLSLIKRPVSIASAIFRHPLKFLWLYNKRFWGLTQKQTEYCVSYLFKNATGYHLDLKNPQSLNEKLQWLNLRYQNPLITSCADKITVRDYISSTVGDKHLIPIIATYDSVEAINFEALPQRFVAKVNWGSGQNIICTDRTKLDIADTKAKLTEWLKPKSNHYYSFFETCYKDIKPKIIIEHFLDTTGDLPDYKFFCYNGEPLNMFIAQNRNSASKELTFTFFDADFNRLPFSQHYMPSDEHIEKPALWNEMLDVARKLSKPFPFVRVDFYIYEGTLKVGELTFCHFGGMTPFTPREWDYKLGAMLKLPLP